MKTHSERPRTSVRVPARAARRRTGDRPRADLDVEARRARIAELAYRIAEQRGFTPGHELDDWLEAERRVDGELRG